MRAEANARDEVGVQVDVRRRARCGDPRQIDDQARRILEGEGLERGESAVGRESHEHATVGGLRRDARQGRRSRRCRHVHDHRRFRLGVEGHVGRRIVRPRRRRPRLGGRLLGPVLGRIDASDLDRCRLHANLESGARGNHVRRPGIRHHDLDAGERRAAILVVGRDGNQVDDAIIGSHLLVFIVNRAHQIVLGGLAHADEVDHQQVLVPRLRHRVDRVSETREGHDRVVTIPRDRDLPDRLSHGARGFARRRHRRRTARSHDGDNDRCHRAPDPRRMPSVIRIDH